MRFLADRGHEVVGVELVEDALHAFFREEGLTPTPEAHPSGVCLSARGLGPDERGSITLIAADFFSITPLDLGAFDFVFDRAALVALPPERRGPYARLELDHLASGGTILLVSLTYDPSRMNPPPHSVPEVEVRSLYAAARRIDTLESVDGLSARTRERGLDALIETAYRIEAPAR